MSDLSGVYVITCYPTGKIYVGSSLRPQARIKDHKTVLAKGTHRNSHLQAAWNKYGSMAFIFEMRVQCLPEDRFAREQELITKLRATDTKYGFNVAHPQKVGKPSPRMSEVSQRSWKNAETRKNRHNGILEKWADEEFYERKMKDGAKARAALAKKRQDPEWCARVSAKTSATMKARAQTEEGRKALLRANQIVHHKRRLDPEFKAQCESGLGKRKS